MPRRRDDARPRGGEVDWEAIRARLAHAVAATEGQLQLTPEQAAAVLEERARRLAQVPEREARGERRSLPHEGEALRVVVMDVGIERYAVEARWVRQAVRSPEITPVPGTRPPFAGLVALHGEVLPVFDARQLLGAAPGSSSRAQGEAAQAGKVVVLGGDAPDVGLLVDDATEVQELRAAALTAPPSGAERAHVRGVTASGLVLLAGDVLLSDERLFVNGTNGGA